LPPPPGRSDVEGATVRLAKTTAVWPKNQTWLVYVQSANPQLAYLQSAFRAGRLLLLAYEQEC
jgi:hypothetical protein